MKKSIEFDYGGVGRGHFKFQNIESGKDFFIFCILRDPLYRSISSYSELKHLAGRVGTGHEKGKTTPQSTQITLASQWYNEKDLCESFRKFIDHIGHERYDPHASLQSSFITDKGLNPADVDHFLVLEHINIYFPPLLKKYKPLKIKTPQFPHERASPPPLKSQLVNLIDSDEALRKKILNIYGADVELYNNAINTNG